MMRCLVLLLLLLLLLMVVHAVGLTKTSTSTDRLRRLPSISISENLGILKGKSGLGDLIIQSECGTHLFVSFIDHHLDALRRRCSLIRGQTSTSTFRCNLTVTTAAVCCPTASSPSSSYWTSRSALRWRRALANDLR